MYKLKLFRNKDYEKEENTFENILKEISTLVEKEKEEAYFNGFIKGLRHSLEKGNHNYNVKGKIVNISI